jgi:uncharacterized protein involved in outer membrane biogenesis
MKKWIIRSLIALVILLLLVVFAVGLFLDAAVKRGVETVGPMLTKVPVKLDSVSLSVLSGSGKIKGLVVGNPEGFKTLAAIQLGAATLSLKPGSVLADKVIIKSINVQAPEITYETNLKQSNIGKILANLEADTGSDQAQPAQPKEAKGKPQEANAGKKLEVDDFVISGGKIHLSLTVMGGKSATVPLADIHLTDLGTGPEGITAGEITKRVLQAIEKQAAQAAVNLASDVGKEATKGATDAAKGASNAVGSAVKGVEGLFKKK